METTESATKPNIGPTDLQPDAGSPFLLSKPEFIAVQTYVEAGKQLPTTSDDLQLKLGITKDDVAEFADLIAIYSQIVAHCKYFSETIFPASVGLAADIVHYNIKVPTYYGALMPIITAWQDGTLEPDKAKAKLDAVVNNLRASAVSYQDNAKAVKEQMTQFVEETQTDKNNLEPIQTQYKQKYEGQDGLIKTYTDQAENARTQIDLWNKEYEHDVIVASTAATYAWLFPFGTIAAGIIAGVYGKKATDALDHVHEYQEKLANVQGELRTALNLEHDMSLASTSLDSILTQLNVALPVLEKMEGTWGAIANDLTNILSVIDEGIDEADALIKDLGVDNAINAWNETAKIADAYRANAYITITTEDDIKANPEKYTVSSSS